MESAAAYGNRLAAMIVIDCSPIALIDTAAAGTSDQCDAAGVIHADLLRSDRIVQIDKGAVVAAGRTALHQDETAAVDYLLAGTAVVSNRREIAPTRTATGGKRDAAAARSNVLTAGVA